MKSNPKFKTISVVSKEFNLPQHVLRFWESKFSQLSPLKLSGNRRYYRKIDIELIGYIKNLLYVDSISIKGVQKIFGRQSVNKIINSKNKIFNKESVFKNNKNIVSSENNTKKVIKEILIDLKKIKSLIDK